MAMQRSLKFFLAILKKKKKKFNKLCETFTEDNISNVFHYLAQL